MGTAARRMVTRDDFAKHCKIRELREKLQEISGKKSAYSGNYNYNYTGKIEEIKNEIQRLSDELTSNQQRIGIAACGVEAKIVNSDNFDEELAHESDSNGDPINSGDFLVYGPWVTKKYYRLSSEEMKGKFHNGYLVTGDIAACNDKEQYMIRDRSKDMIKTGGEWVSSVDMENKIMDLLNSVVSMSVVVSAKHPKWDERPIAIVQLKDDVKHKNKNKDEEFRQELFVKIRQKLSETYAKFQLPDDLLIWDEIPMTGTGKISKKNVREKLAKENYILPSLRKQSKL